MCLGDANQYHSYGNLYFKNDAFPDCGPAVVVGDVQPSLKEEVKDRFVIGPVIDRAFWDGERSAMDLDRGPCKLYSQAYYAKHNIN